MRHSPNPPRRRGSHGGALQESRGRHGGFEADEDREHSGGHGPRGGGRGRGPGSGRRRGPSSRGGRPRGDVRAAVLVLLAEQPRHGYDLIRAIDERSNGGWTPSPGSIYPTLQALEDEGLITIDTVEGRKTASLAPDGHAWLEEHRGEAAKLFDTAEPSAGSAGQIRAEVAALRDAAMHVARHPGHHDAGAQAVDILAGARKALYRLLAGEDS